MSFLAGRLASTEGAYFLQESKQTVTRILEKNPKVVAKTIAAAESNLKNNSEISPTAADVLPEVLKHSLPSKVFRSDSSNSSSSRASKWALKPPDPDGRTGSAVSPDAINPLRGYVSLPQVTFGPKRWQLPNSENSVLPSTANDLRQDRHTTINPEKLKAAASGLSLIGSAFAVATAIVFGGGAVVFGLTASKLNMRNTDDIRTKGRDLVQPKFDSVREQLVPLRTWAEKLSTKLHLEREKSIKKKPLIKELSRTFGSTKNSV